MRRAAERWLVGLLLLVFGAYAVAEELQMVSYYPSARAVYEEVRVQNGPAKIALSTPGTQANHESRIDFLTRDNPGNGQLEDVGSFGWRIRAFGDQYVNGKVVAQQNDLAFTRWNGTAETDPILIDFATDNVGIGTITPLDILHVQRDVNGSAAVRITNANTAPGAGATLRFGDGTNPDLMSIGLDRNVPGAEPFVWTTGGQDLRIGTGSGASSAERIRIKEATGFVGIGTNAPNATLDVRSNAEFRNRIGVGGGFDPFTNGGTAGIWTSASANDPTFFYGIEDPAPGAGKAGIWTKTAGVGWMVTYTTSGQVGIGTTAPTPGMRLEVAGSTFVTGNLQVQGATTINDNVGVTGSATGLPDGINTATAVGQVWVCIGGDCRTGWPLGTTPGTCTSTSGRLASPGYICNVKVRNACAHNPNCPAGWQEMGQSGGLVNAGQGCNMVTCAQWCTATVCVP